MGEVIDFEKYRQENNKRVLEKFRSGDNLATSKPEDTWYPPKGIFDRSKGRMVPVAPPAAPPPSNPQADKFVASTRLMVDNFKAGIAAVADDAVVGIKKTDLMALIVALEVFLPH